MSTVEEDTGVARYRTFLAVPHTRSLIGWALLARMPLGMAPLALLLLLRSEGATYAVGRRASSRPTDSRSRAERSSRGGSSTGAGLFAS